MQCQCQCQWSMSFSPSNQSQTYEMPATAEESNEPATAKKTEDNISSLTLDDTLPIPNKHQKIDWEITVVASSSLLSPLRRSQDDLRYVVNDLILSLHSEATNDGMTIVDAHIKSTALQHIHDWIQERVGENEDSGDSAIMVDFKQLRVRRSVHQMEF